MRTLKLIMAVLVIGVFHQSALAQKSGHDVKISPDKASVHFQNQSSFLIEISGPNNYYFRETVKGTNEISIANVKADGTKFSDGHYNLQITPVYEMDDTQKETLQKLRLSGDQIEIKEFRKENNLPEKVEATVINFSIKGGMFVSPSTKEGGIGIISTSNKWDVAHPSLYASISHKVVDFAPRVIDNNWNMDDDDQVFADDVIVQSSLCVGFDCANGENFGFDTQRLKENNLRVHFDDTSSSASFPSNDWRLAANDTSNGGANYFAIQDATAGTTPFRVEAGAGNNALHVDASGGNVGMGTATPVVELHVTDGDTPTMRLEQNGSNGWTPQTWDIAGNETNFFVRDVTGGSKLPFKIKPGAPDNALFVAADGDIGLGTANPDSKLHLKTGNLNVEAGDVKVGTGNVEIVNGKLGIGTTPTTTLDVNGIMKITGSQSVTGTSSYRGDILAFAPNQISFRTNIGGVMVHMASSTGFVGIGDASPSHLLELSADDAVKPNGGSWSAPSDRRLKKNIVGFNDGLNVLSQLNPVSYNYNGKLDLPTEKTFIGMIAQEVQAVAPYMVKPLNDQSELGIKENYLAFDPSAMTYVLINSVKEQQEIIEEQTEEIEALKEELEALKGLEDKLAELSAKVDLMTTKTSSEVRDADERD